MNTSSDGGPVMHATDMTLRDYFAAKAMVALIAEPVGEGWPNTVAIWANHVQGRALDVARLPCLEHGVSHPIGDVRNNV